MLREERKVLTWRTVQMAAAAEYGDFGGPVGEGGGHR